MRLLSRITIWSARMSPVGKSTMFTSVMHSVFSRFQCWAALRVPVRRRKAVKKATNSNRVPKREQGFMGWIVSGLNGKSKESGESSCGGEHPPYPGQGIAVGTGEKSKKSLALF